MHIERTDIQASETITLSAPVSSLLQCCAESAQTILQTLRVLADDDLMGMIGSLHLGPKSKLTYPDAFLPFQIEDASSSAFVLYLIRAIAPSIISNELWCENLECVLDKLVSKGNIAAPLRRLELRHLEHVLAPLTPKISSNPLPPNLNEENEGNEPSMFDQEEFEWDMLGLNSSVSLPPQELLELADQLDVDGMIQSADI